MQYECGNNQNNQIKKMLLNSAIHFLNLAAINFERDQKIALIFHCTAIELILKAKIATTDWREVIVKVAKTYDFDFTKFMSGKLKTITIGEAISKNFKSCDDKRLEKEFKDLANERNKVIHFFHKAYVGDDSDDDCYSPAGSLNHNNEKTRLGVLIATTFNDIIDLIKAKWSADLEVSPYKIEDLEKILHQYDKYINAKYKKIEPEIYKLDNEGAEITQCKRCDKKAFIHEKEVCDMIFRDQCLVCGLVGICTIRMECQNPDCDNVIEQQEESEKITSCNECGEKHCFEEIFPQELEGVSIICNYCENHDTVVIHHSFYICTVCLCMSEDYPSECGRCGYSQLGENDSGLCYSCLDYI